jgi:hypothetical protein
MTVLNQKSNSNTIGTLNGFVDLDVEGCSTVSLQILNTYTGTIALVGAIDDANFNYPIQLYRDGFGFQPLTLASGATGLFSGICSKYKKVRAIMSAYTPSNVAAVTLLAEPMIDPFFGQARASDNHLRLQTAAATFTLPAVTGLFHNITRLEIKAHVTIATVAAVATAVTDITTTNLGGLAWDLAYETLALGRAEPIIVQPCSPMRSVLAGTATSFILPALTGILWDVKVSYYTGL